MDTQTIILTEEQRAIRQMVRDFVDNELRPAVRESFVQSGAPGQHDAPPEELLRKVDALGIRTIMVPEEYGGVSYDMQTLAIIEEELGRGGRRLGITQNCWKAWDRIAKTLPKHIQEYWFPRIMADPTFVACNAATESSGASNRWLPYKSPEANMNTKAVLQDGHWVLNGQKQFITNGANAKLIFLNANTDPDVGGEYSAFMVPLGTPGLTVGPRPGDFYIENCRVPADHKLGRDPAPFNSKVLVAAGQVGLAAACYEETVEFCRGRYVGGRYVVQHQLVGASLGEMAAKLASMRGVVNLAARGTDLGASDAHLMAEMALVHVAQSYFDIAKRAVELWGGMGTTRDSVIFPYLHQATVALHLDGTMDIQKLSIAQRLFPEAVGVYAGPVPEAQQAVPAAAD